MSEAIQEGVQQELTLKGNYSLSPLTANSLFQVSKHNPLGIRILVQSARG